MKIYYIILLTSILYCGCSNEEKQTIGIYGTIIPECHHLVEINCDEISVKPGTSVVVSDQKKIYESQWIDQDGDGCYDLLCVDVQDSSCKSVDIIAKPSNRVFAKRTQAELWYKTTGKFIDGKYIGGGNFSKFDTLRVPEGFTDHAYFMKYEGPGWESNKVGYRLYLDWRNAVDVFGKKTDLLILQDVGVDGYESYHHMQDWGMDILKVGKSLGIGTTAWWNGEKAIRIEKTDSVACHILSDGNLRSQVQVEYYGWQTDSQKVDVNSIKSIDVDRRMTHEVLRFDTAVSNICTGIVTMPNTEEIYIDSPNNTWACIATWGKQSLNHDDLGLAIIFPKSQSPVVTEDKYSKIVYFEESLEQVEYYFMAAWSLESGGISSKSEFINELTLQLKQLEAPVWAEACP